ncbi:hypothetical protein NDI76_15530 [Halogeometricum sp. S1BR25-6]|uniref:Flagellin n=1 Tax=Halogeometricum salsisoli TaxID=2950536 RepID=A0ABU2GH73_9EURY|nr:hypothetical protein [Halogeometricum sp. S1BR25-6]MDS0300157.1 hypothetical protein [Halogeometricum sp. S1BR25-6]
MTDRAQAETLGFSTVFGLVMLMIVVVSLVVYPAIEDVQNSQRVSNVERGMAAFAGNVNDVVGNDAPRRSTGFRLDGGQLALGDPVTVTVTGDAFDETYEVRPLVYRSDDGTELVYVNGAVVRDDGHGVVMLTEPRLQFSDQGVVLPVVRLDEATGPAAVGGSTRVATVREATRVAVADRTPQRVSITITSPRADAWQRTLESDAGATCGSVSGETLTCTVDTQRVSVVVVDVDVSFE